ncbi:MAG: CoA transferase, partial [Firmicutes bacterium]|nr:CoA transferase [Bacillota bacterium]
EARLKEDHARELLQVIRDWAATRTREEIDALGELYRFASAPVMSFKDQNYDPHLRARGMVWEIDDPVYGRVVEVGPVVKMSETPGRLRWSAKPVGFDNEYVFIKMLGLRPSELKALEEKGVIGKWAPLLGSMPPDDWRGEGQIF